MGRWSRFSYFGNKYNLPGCSSTVNSLQIVDGAMKIESCESVKALEANISAAIFEANRHMNFCNDPTCQDELTIKNDCTSERILKVKRQAPMFESATFTVSYQLNIT
jgi:hypothetical protein